MTLPSSLVLLTLAPCSDFYNYFRYGIDFLISGKTHVVEKIVLHTNIVSFAYLALTSLPHTCQPGSPLFQRYKRCNWEIEGTPEDDEDGNLRTSTCTTLH